MGGMNPTDDGENPYGITCPTCAARPGEKCTSRNWRNPTVYHYPHVNREHEARNWPDTRRAEARRAIERRRANPKEDMSTNGISEM